MKRGRCELRQRAEVIAAKTTSLTRCLTPAADAPRPAAAAAASPAASTAATTSATPGDFLPELRLCGIFLVEHIECRQADVRDFLVTEKDFVIWRDVLRRNIRHLSAGRCGRSTR